MLILYTKMASDADLATASVIAILILIVLICVWPGLARVRGRDLAGYWAAPDGRLYEIRDAPGAKAGGRTFAVTWALDKPSLPSGRQSAWAPNRQTATGEASGVRGITVAALGKQGHVELGGRLISWKGGDSWTRQGVHA